MNSLISIPKVTVGEFTAAVSGLYTSVCKKNYPFSMVPAPFLWGPPGVGKSQGVYQFAENLRIATGRKVVVTDIRLSMFSPIDLRGVPVADAEKEFTIWLKPKIFALDESDDVINLLFFDELSSAPQQVQAAAYQITLDHRIGEHRLPDNCIIIGAGNRTIDRSVVFRMPNALANRLQHYEIAADFDAWRKWAIQNKVHPLVMGYLSFDNSKLCMEEVPAEQIAFPTPRTWMFVSHILSVMEPIRDINELYPQIGACVGTDTALSFVSWCRNHKELPDVREIFRGNQKKYPASMDALYALICSMISYVESAERGEREGFSGGITMAELDNMAVYASRFPADYRACLYHRLEQDEQAKSKLVNVKLYKEFKRKNENAS